MESENANRPRTHRFASIAKAHGGTITVSSSERGHGTTVRFYVPLDAEMRMKPTVLA